VKAAQHLTQLGVHCLGSEPDTAERSHLDGERPIVAHEERGADHLGRDLGLARLVNELTSIVPESSRETVRRDLRMSRPR